MSSCEAEVFATNKGAAETSGIWRIEFDIVPQTDASAARGVVDSPGPGKTLRHIDTHKLWSPIGIKGQDMVVRKMGSDENIADMLTNDVKSETAAQPCGAHGFHQRSGTR